MLKSIFHSLVFFLFSGSILAQQAAIGQWRSHLPYNNAIAVAEVENKIYCATKKGIFFLDKSDESIQRISTVNGLAEVSISAMKYNKYKKLLVVGYENGNIDLLDSNNKILNLPYVKNKNLTGKKAINNITMIDQYAYLSCGFGVLVLNLNKQEISETYYLGPAGTLEVLDFTYDGSVFYAATPHGIYTAPDNSPNLADFIYWKRIQDLPDGIFNTITYFNNKIYSNYSKYLTSGNNGAFYNTDTIFCFDGTAWNDVTASFYGPAFNWLTRRIETDHDKLVVTSYIFSGFFDASGSRTNIATGYGLNGSASPWESISDKDNNIWIADEFGGLYKNVEFNFQKLTPNGPDNAESWMMASSNGNLWVTTGGYTGVLTNTYSRSGLHQFAHEEWKSLNENTNSSLNAIVDFISVVTDPSDPNHIFAGCWGDGLLEFKSGVLISTNKGLSTTGNAVGGLAYDNNRNLWIASSSSGIPQLTKLKSDGTSASFSLPGISGFLIDLVIDTYDQLWFINPRGTGLMVGKENTVPIYSKDSTSTGANSLVTTSATCIALDLDGQLWVGTSTGAGVIYSTGNVFTNGGFDVQKILVEQDGHAQYLLETETITAIAVDGNNRKWFGTAEGGVFLMSSDGTKQLEHFTSENSPLFSNNITSIAINGETGEVFFGTLQGIISYRGSATDGNEEMKTVTVFPNPVREGYTGQIGIRGLVQNAAVKITDISGTLVYETYAYGGQATWDGKNLKGEKAHTGIYLIFCSGSDGSQTMVSKILFVN